MSMGTKIKKIFPLRITPMTVARHHVNLLCVTADETSLYVLIKDLSRLASCQYNSNYHKNISVDIVCMAVPAKSY